MHSIRATALTPSFQGTLKQTPFLAPMTMSDNGGIPLKDWINGALASIEHSEHAATPIPGTSNSKRTSATSSESFLFSALKIAYSLTHQLCQAENFNAQSGAGRGSVLPMAGFDWSDHIVVFLASTSKKSLESDSNPYQPIDIQLHSKEYNSAYGSFMKQKDMEEKKVGGCMTQRRDISYLNVQRAKIVQSTYDSICISKAEDENRRLYSLGLVFYELFSGGSKPPEVSTNQSGSSQIKLHQSDDRFLPLPIHEPAPINLSIALQVLDQLSDDDEHFHEDDGHEKAKRPRSSNNNSGQKASGKMNTISVEPLKLQGLPAALCDLIGNMIDCANGDFKGNESYNYMSDVLTDLRLMLEKPYKFLFDRNVAELAVSSLQLDESLFGREAEFSSLLSAYQRSSSGEHEMAIIAGPSGTGKSFLAQKLARSVASSGGLFLEGKFDQLKQARPFSAIASAFNEFCDGLIGKGDSEQLDMIACALKEDLDKEEVSHLEKVIPSLCKITGHSPEFDVGTNSHECVDAQKRLQYLLCQFLTIISSSSSEPVALFLDDLQWADTASIGVINQLVLNAGAFNQSGHFFFLGCYRDDEMTEGHPVLGMISGLQSFGVRVTKVTLTSLDKHAINTITSNLLCLSPRLTRSLSEIIHHKTKGNPLFYFRLMTSLSKEGILRFNLARRRWDWDEVTIQSRQLPDDVASFFTDLIQRQPKEFQTALFVLSCFGASTDRSLIKRLEEKLDVKLLTYLDLAVAEGFLDKMGDVYRFRHDRVQQAAYNMIDPSSRQSKHFEYGLALSFDSLEMGSSPFLFSAVGQLNRGSPSLISNPSQGAKVALLNLLAGDQAMEISDFTTSSYFYQHGILFLPENSWSRHYDLSLKLFEGAAKCALAVAEFENLERLSKQVLSNARSFEDTLVIEHTSICALLHTSRLNDLVEKASAILKRLGEDLPQSFDKSQLDFHVERTNLMLSGFTAEQLLNYKQATNPSKIMAMKFLSCLQMALLLLRSDMQPFIVLKLCQLSLVHGTNSISPLAFALYGSLLGRQGNIQEGYRYVKIAKELLDRTGTKEEAGKVYLIVAQMAFAFEPMQAANDILIRGHTLAMSAGDIDNSMLNISLHSNHIFWMGTKLETVEGKIDDVVNQMKRHGNVKWLSSMMAVKRSVSMLIRSSHDCDNASRDDAEVAVLEKSPHLKMHFYLHEMYTSFMDRKYNDVKYYAQLYFENKVNHRVFSLTFVMSNFIDGLVSFWMFRKSGDPLWIQRGKDSLSEVQHWSETSMWNYQSKKLLLEAEEHFCNNNTECAKISYDNAIAAARQHKFINEEALSYELAANFYLETGDLVSSIQYFTKAQERYKEWGALAKAVNLHQFVRQCFDLDR